VKGKDKHDSARFGLIAATVLLASVTVAKVAQSVVESRRIERLALSTAQDDADPNAAQPWRAGAQEVAQTLREKNLFVKMPPKKHPVQQVDGILGREVLIKNRWYKAGDRVGGAKIVSVDSTHAVIEWDGQRKPFAPIAAASAEVAATPKPAVVKPKEVDGQSPKTATATAAEGETATAAETVVAEDPLAWLGIELPPEVRAMLLEKWNSASEEEKQQAKEEWNKMSDEEKRQAVRSLEEHG